MRTEKFNTYFFELPHLMSLSASGNSRPNDDTLMSMTMVTEPTTITQHLESAFV